MLNRIFNKSATNFFYFSVKRNRLDSRLHKVLFLAWADHLLDRLVICVPQSTSFGPFGTDSSVLSL